MSRILVTGGAGFIGSHVAEALIEASHTVAVLDNLSSGKRENVPEAARFYHVDITDKEGLEAFFAEFKPEIVNHHAAQISVNRSVREPCFDAEQNILGTINLLEASARHGVKRFIFASTGGALYGDAGEGCVIYGTGEQTRDFVYVKDVARSNLAAVDGEPGTYNIGTGIETSINKLFSEFKRLEGSLKVSHDAARAGEVFRSVLDANRARSALGWQPQVSLSHGIRETYTWFKQRLG